MRRVFSGGVAGPVAVPDGAVVQPVSSSARPASIAMKAMVRPRMPDPLRLSGSEAQLIS
jgi:hypothetical protein